MLIVNNTTGRLESLNVRGLKAQNKVVFTPGFNEINDEEYQALISPKGKKAPVFTLLVEQGGFVIQGDTQKEVTKDTVKADKEQAKAEKKAAEKAAEETKKAVESERKRVRDEISGLLKKNKARSMKYDDLAEDYCVERKDIKELVKVSDIEASNLFLEWLQSETR